MPAILGSIPSKKSTHSITDSEEYRSRRTWEADKNHNLELKRIDHRIYKSLL